MVKKRFKNKSLKNTRFSPLKLAAFLVIFGSIGGYTLWRSFAAAPVGYFDVIYPNGVAAGWACDDDKYSVALKIDFYLDKAYNAGGTYVGTATAGDARTDITNLCGGHSNHGFNYQIPPAYLDGKAHTLYAYAKGIDSNGNSVGTFNNLNFSPRSYNIAGNTPKGYFDNINSAGVAYGWSCDADSYSTALEIHFYDGAAGTGKFLGGARANQSRPDVASVCGGQTARGFTYSLPAAARDGKQHSIYAYALNVNSSGALGGNNPLLAGSPRKYPAVVITPPPPPPASKPTVKLAGSPASISYNNYTYLQWSSTNATSCSASWTTSKATTGTQKIGRLTATQTYSITCSGAGGTASTSAKITVAAAPKGCPPNCPAPAPPPAPVQELAPPEPVAEPEPELPIVEEEPDVSTKPPAKNKTADHVRTTLLTGLLGELINLMKDWWRN